MAWNPVITQQDIDWLVALPKPVRDNRWRDALLPPRTGPIDLRGRLDLDSLPDGSPLGGTLHLYTRQNLSQEVDGDWSVGLVYTDYADNSYRVLRCNGPHPSPHTNRIEGTTIVKTPHIHRLTERYQTLRRPSPDGYAEPTDAYATIEDAVNHMIGLVNLQPEGILFL